MEVGVRETDADIEGFREIFGRTVICGEDEMTLEAYIRTLETDSEFDIEYYCPEKEWISELLSIGSFGIKNLYDGTAGYDIITGEHLSKREKESRFIWGIIETALSIFLAVAAATGLLGKIGSKLSQKISPLIEKLEPYIKPHIPKIDDAVGHVQKQIRQAVQRAGGGGVVDDTFRLEPIAGETIETLGKDAVQESGEAAGRRILHEESGTVEEIQAVVTDEIESRLDSGLMQSKIDEIINTPKGSRPDPSTYLSQEYIDAHLAQFDDGASIIMTKEQYINYVKGNSTIGIPTDGTQFVLPKNYCDDIASNAAGDIGYYEKALGFDTGHFSDGGGLVRIDIKNLDGLNLRIPSGNEAGANSHWVPGGKTDGGVPEAISDLIPNVPNNVTVLEIK